MTIKAMGSETEADPKRTTLRLQLDGQEVAADGDAEIMHRIDRVRMRVEAAALHAVRVRLELRPRPRSRADSKRKHGSSRPRSAPNSPSR